MDISRIKTAADAVSYVRSRDPALREDRPHRRRRHHARQVHGRDKFVSALEKGFGFCDVVLGWDSNDQLYDNVTLTGWHTAYPDAPVRVLPETMRLIPFEDDLPFFLGEFDD